MAKTGLTLPALILVAGVVLAGCSDSEAGAPASSDDAGANSSALTSPNGDLPHSGAPAVAQPINTKKWESDPCSVISAKQFSSIGFDDVDAEPNPHVEAGPTCDWYPSNATLAGFSGAFITGDPPTEGLSRLYERRELGDYKVWQELRPIAGHPAIRAEYKDESDRGICGITVGVRNDLAYGVEVTDEDKEITNDPCAFAQKIANLAVKTMKGEG
ncbi:DUF3558 domain-containing protein [Haloechinothrix salitolerans]|uniref:DUF3558 domain-containing protein n=1 Tax=Haloechinothrix salitolerans TaxID=926830 RepID=A0ABW2BRB8_9PSEU